jgi:parvulin-like peptidyl-prolyl isomerase
LNKGKLLLASLASLALPFTTPAQTRTRRAPATKPASRPAAPRGTQPAATPKTQVNITGNDIALLVQGLNFPPEAVGELASSAEERAAFSKDFRQMLGAAAEARSRGYAARPEVKLQTELARAFVLAQAYFKRQQDAGIRDPEQIVPSAEIDAYLAEPATAPQFEAFVGDYVKNGPTRGAPVTDDQRKALARQYGRVMVGMRKAVAAGLERERKTQLVVMYQEARLLAGAYSKEDAASYKATDAEVDAYIAKHPEFDTKASRAKAEDVLRRVRAGEDFAGLAREFSQDPGSKAQGGDLGWFGRGTMVKPFEDAAFALKPNEVSGIVESPFGYHIIKLEERRGGANGQAEEVRARHILIPFTAEPLSGGGRPMSPRERARSEVEAEKRDRAFDEMAARHGITVAEDFPVGPSVTSGDIEQGVETSPGAAASSAKPAAQPAPAAKPKTSAPAKRTPSKRGH